MSEVEGARKIDLPDAFVIGNADTLVFLVMLTFLMETEAKT